MNTNVVCAFLLLVAVVISTNGAAIVKRQGGWPPEYGAWPPENGAWPPENGAWPPRYWRPNMFRQMRTRPPPPPENFGEDVGEPSEIGDGGVTAPWFNPARPPGHPRRPVPPAPVAPVAPVAPAAPVAPGAPSVLVVPGALVGGAPAGR